MAARRERLGLSGLMCARTALSLRPTMRAPIANRKKVYPGKRQRGARSAVDTPAPLDTPAMQASVTDKPLSAGDCDAPSQPSPLLATRLDRQETIELAKTTLQTICLSSDAPSNAKATAARTLLELVGALGRHANPSDMNIIPASEMSLEQLEARIAALASH